MGLNQRAVLISLVISQWGGRKQDRLAAATATAAHGADSDAGNFWKRLLPKAPELEAVFSQARAIRKMYYSKTLPWAADGARLISVQSYLALTQEFRKMRSEFDLRVAEFVSAYPRLQDQAKASLGDLFNAAEYPAADQIAGKFRIELFVSPVPDVGDFRIELSEEEKRVFQEQVSAAENRAMEDCRKRLLAPILTAVETLKQPGKRFRDSLIGNLAEIVDALPALAVSQDAELENARLAVAELIKSVSPDLLRENESERSKTASQLEEISKAMGAFMGGQS